MAVCPPDPLMQYFEYKHLPDRLQVVSKEFHWLASFISEKLPRNEETSMALRKLLEAKDCAVRGAL